MSPTYFRRSQVGRNPGDLLRYWLPSGLCVAFGLFLVGVGGVLLVDAEAGERLFGFGVTGGAANSFLLATGARQMYLGMLVLATLWACQWRALGIVLVTIAAVPLGDSLITLTTARSGPRGSLRAPTRAGSAPAWGVRPARRPNTYRSASRVGRDRRANMRILVLGATGATGRHLVEQALAQGHVVSALARNPTKLEGRGPNVTVEPGDVADSSAVERAVRKHDAVLCALGAATPLRRDPSLVEGVGNLVAAMQRLRVPRLEYLSFLGVRAGRHQLSPLGRHVVAPLLLHNVAADHEAKEIIIQHSNLDWVIVRPPRLTNGPIAGNYRSGENIRATMAIPRLSRADLAEFMLRQLHDDAYLHRAPAVMY